MRGEPIVIDGSQDSHALFATAPSALVYALNGEYEQFAAIILLSDQFGPGCGDGAVFRVDLDGETAYLSPVMKVKSKPVTIRLDVSEATTLRLETHPSSDFLTYPPNADCDWTIWGDPHLVSSARLATTNPVPAPNSPDDSASARKEFYVSPGGDDHNDGTINSPFATLTHARDVIRTINRNMDGPITVYLRGGNYDIQDTIAFDERDSGTNGYKIIYQAYAGETPVISGGRDLTGSWEPVDGEPYLKMMVPDNVAPFRNLYVNGQRAFRAAMEAPIIGLDWWKGDWSEHDGIIVKTSDILQFSHPEDLELHWNLDWVDARLRADKIIDLGNGESAIIMKQPYFFWGTATEAFAFNEKWTPGWYHPFYLENARELLDQPGEWYYDKREYELYYYPRPGETPDNLKVEIPQVETLVKLQGSKPNSPIRNLEFSGLTFANSSWMRASLYGTRMVVDQPTDGYLGELFNAPAAVEIKNASDVTFEKNSFYHMGATALDLINGDHNIDLTGNSIQDVSKNAIVIGLNVLDARPEDAGKMDPLDIGPVSVSDNLINDIGVEYWGSPGIEYYYGTNITVAHNDIRNIANSGIEINGWLQGCLPTCPQSRIIDISNNRIENVSTRGQYPKPFDLRTTGMTDMTGFGGDAGGIYTNNAEPGLTINDNYIKNVVNHYACIYLDMNSTGVAASRNICDQAPAWISLLQEQAASYGGSQTARDIYFDDNYTNALAYLNFPNLILINEARPYVNQNLDVSITNTHYLPGSNWPPEALTVIEKAGLEPEYQYLLSNVIK